SISTVFDRRAMCEAILVMYPMCVIGVACRPLVRSSVGSRAPSIRRTASMFATVNVAPFGEPVVPLVYTIASGSSGAPDASGDASSTNAISSGEDAATRRSSSASVAAPRERLGRAVQLEHPRSVPPEDLLALFLRDVAHLLLDDPLRVRPRRIGVRVVRPDHDV